MLLLGTPTAAPDDGRDIYRQRCFWCHGEEGRGDGPSAIGMLPRPRDFVGGEYKIRSTRHGQLPTSEDLARVIARGLPGTPMPGWEKVLDEEQIQQLVSYVKSLSPRFAAEAPETIAPPPNSTGSAERGREVYRNARCFMCHGQTGRGDGGITTTLSFEWGWPYAARDLTRGWTFKGGQEPHDIYLRVTGGLNGTPMGPYEALLSDQERWDVAHYVASLDEEPDESSSDFALTATYVNGPLPQGHGAAEWEQADAILVALAGQVVLDPPLRWWIPTTGSATVRSLWNAQEVAFLVEWNDPTGPDSPRDGLPDSAFIQFAAEAGTKPYFLLGDADNAVRLWRWQAGDASEEQTATGSAAFQSHATQLQANGVWENGRWHVVFRRALAGEPRFESGAFVPVLFSVCDGANGEVGNTRALSTWLYATLEPPPSLRPWLLGLASLLGTALLQVWILSRLSS